MVVIVCGVCWLLFIPVGYFLLLINSKLEVYWGSNQKKVCLLFVH